MKKFEKVAFTGDKNFFWKQLDTELAKIDKNFIINVEEANADITYKVPKNLLGKVKDLLMGADYLSVGHAWVTDPFESLWGYVDQDDNKHKDIEVEEVAKLVKAELDRQMAASAGENESLKRESLERRISRLERLLK